MKAAKCGDCGEKVAVGDWPFCPHGPMGHGMLGEFKAYYDEHVAPPPGKDFKPTGATPDYHPEHGYYVTSLADRWRLMKLAKMDYRGIKNGMGRREM